jgi:hypothetical protein
MNTKNRLRAAEAKDRVLAFLPQEKLRLLVKIESLEEFLAFKNKFFQQIHCHVRPCNVMQDEDKFSGRHEREVRKRSYLSGPTSCQLRPNVL